MARWWNQTGGLGYHFIAWSQRRSWQSFRAQLNDFLTQEVPLTPRLVILGASGGYTLCSSWLQKFPSLEVIDPDPLAPGFFRRQHPKIKVRWSRQNYLVHQGGTWNWQGLAQLHSQYPDATFLFANLIGQLPLVIKTPALDNPENWRQWREGWWKFFAQTPWISIHDLFSAARPPTHVSALQLGGVCAEEFVQGLYGAQATEVTDHLTYDLFPTSVRRHRLLWPLTRERCHVVEVALPAQAGESAV